MNVESNSNIQRTQSGKPISYKRAHRAHRPVLVTEPKSTVSTATTVQTVEETPVTTEAELAEQPTISTEPERKRGPRFFSSVSRTEKLSDQPAADPKAARLARALRGKGTDVDAPKNKEAGKEKKAVSGSSRPASAAPARPKSGFKMKYIWGMMIYLLFADVLGVWIADFMQTHGMDAVVFTISTFQAKRSTLVFLALLVVILVIMARLDLIPRSLGAAMSGSSPQGKNASASRSSSKSNAPTFSTKEAQSTMKQGVKGENDNLYREYRENQRYFQKRDRKR